MLTLGWILRLCICYFRVDTLSQSTVRVPWVSSLGFLVLSALKGFCPWVALLALVSLAIFCPREKTEFQIILECYGGGGGNKS